MHYPDSTLAEEWIFSPRSPHQEMTSQPFAGLRVLLVEDVMIIAMEFEDVLGTLGCVVSGPVGRLSAALRMAQEGAFDIAILDVNLDGEMVFPVAAALRERGIPFAFSTGYGDSSLPPEWRDAPHLGKPVRYEDLIRFLKRASAN